MTIDNETQLSPASSGLSRCTESATVDYVVAAVSLALFAIWIFTFRFHGVFEEYDLYNVVSGLLDGVDSGKKFASPLQYGPSFSFGYIAAMYWFVNDRVLRDPNLLIPLVNQIGSWAAITGAVCFWLSTRLLYGLRVATIALTLFILSPMILESATSGHQILLAFAFFAAGSIFLFLRTSGWARYRMRNRRVLSVNNRAHRPRRNLPGPTVPGPRASRFPVTWNIRKVRISLLSRSRSGVCFIFPDEAFYC